MLLPAFCIPKMFAVFLLCGIFKLYRCCIEACCVLHEVVALAACSVLWRTTPILLLCTVLAGSVGAAAQLREGVSDAFSVRASFVLAGCMSSVTYWAAVAQRPASCVRGMSAAAEFQMASLCYLQRLAVTSDWRIGDVLMRTG